MTWVGRWGGRQTKGLFDFRPCPPAHHAMRPRPATERARDIMMRAHPSDYEDDKGENVRSFATDSSGRPRARGTLKDRDGKKVC